MQLYDVTETFCFPDQTVAEMYKKYMIENVVINHILTDTDSTALQFTFISDPNSDLPEDNFRDVIFEVIIATKIYKRFDTSRILGYFLIQERKQKNELGYYEIENIDNPCLVTIAVNPKEYLEVFQNTKLNKKHKGIKKGSSGIEFENFSKRINSLVNFDTFEKPSFEYKQVSRLTVDKGEMVK